MRLVITHLDSRPITSTMATGLESRWEFIQDAVASEFDVSPDEVSEIETDDGDMIAINGTPVARVTRRYGWAS